MNVLLFFIPSSILFFTCKYYLPAYYEKIVKSVIQQGKELGSVKIQLDKKPFLAFILIFSVFVFYYFNQDKLMLSAFLLLFSISAYVDAVSRWVPDVLIHACSWVSLLALTQERALYDIMPSFCSVTILVSLMLIANLWGMKKLQKEIYGEGDIYLAASIGLWLDPAFTIFYLTISHLIAILIGRGRKDVAFVPVMYFSFIVYILI